MPLAFEPEPITSLQHRYKHAIETVFDPGAPDLTPEDYPGSKRAHVFDCEDGMRILICREYGAGRAGIYLHVSASWEKKSHFAARAAALLDLNAICQSLYERFEVISGDKGPQIPLTHLSVGKGIPHWYRLEFRQANESEGGILKEAN